MRVLRRIWCLVAGHHLSDVVGEDGTELLGAVCERCETFWAYVDRRGFRAGDRLAPKVVSMMRYSEPEPEISDAEIRGLASRYEKGEEG